MTAAPVTRTALALAPEAQDLLFRQARTANTFTDEPVTDEQIEAIYDLVKFGPTSINCQPLRVVLVRSEQARARLVPHMAESNQAKTRQAPLVAILAADTEFHDELPRLVGARAGLPAPPTGTGARIPAQRGGTPGGVAPPAAGVARATALSMVALVAVGLTRLVHGSLVSHATDRATYGLVGSLLATVVVASLVLPGGASSAMAKFVAFHRGAGDLPAARAAYRFLTRLSAGSALLLGLVTGLVTGGVYHLRRAHAAAGGVLPVAYSLSTVDQA